jgi:hypothetical protein
MKNKTKQVVFDIVKILMFYRNNSPKNSQINALFLNESNICEIFGALFLKNIKISKISKTTCFVLFFIIISIFMYIQGNL